MLLQSMQSSGPGGSSGLLLPVCRHVQNQEKKMLLTLFVLYSSASLANCMYTIIVSNFYLMDLIHLKHFDTIKWFVLA